MANILTDESSTKGTLDELLRRLEGSLSRLINARNSTEDTTAMDDSFIAQVRQLREKNPNFADLYEAAFYLDDIFRTIDRLTAQDSIHIITELKVEFHKYLKTCKGVLKDEDVRSRYSKSQILRRILNKQRYNLTLAKLNQLYSSRDEHPKTPIASPTSVASPNMSKPSLQEIYDVIGRYFKTLKGRKPAERYVVFCDDQHEIQVVECTKPDELEGIIAGIRSKYPGTWLTIYRRKPSEEKGKIRYAEEPVPPLKS